MGADRREGLVFPLRGMHQKPRTFPERKNLAGIGGEFSRFGGRHRTAEGLRLCGRHHEPQDWIKSGPKESHKAAPQKKVQKLPAAFLLNHPASPRGFSKAECRRSPF